MNEAKINEDGNLVVNPLEILLIQQEFETYREITEQIEGNLKEQIVGYKEAFAKLWEEVGTAAISGDVGKVVAVLNRSMVFYDLVVGRKG